MSCDCKSHRPSWQWVQSTLDMAWCLNLLRSKQCQHFQVSIILGNIYLTWKGQKSRETTKAEMKRTPLQSWLDLWTTHWVCVECGQRHTSDWGASRLCSGSRTLPDSMVAGTWFSGSSHSQWQQQQTWTKTHFSTWPKILGETTAIFNRFENWKWTF